MDYDYGDPRRGASFEDLNFRSALEGMGHELVRFDAVARARRDGKPAMRRALVAKAAETAPDVAFFCLFESELDRATIRAVGQAGACPTINWFTDDHWR